MATRKPRLRKPHYAGFGTSSQFYNLVTIVLSGIALWRVVVNDHDQQTAQTAIAQSAVARETEIDKETNAKIVRLWDFTRETRRDLETGFRHDIDNACACCRR